MTDTLLETGPRVEAQDDGSSRWYLHPDTQEQYLSVTHVTGACTSKPWLGPWAAKTAAQYAVDFAAHWQATFRDAGPADRRDAAVKEITRTAAENRDLKAAIGIYEHDIFEALLLDTPIPGMPDHLDGRIVEFDDELQVIDQAWLDQIADGLLNFVTDFGWRAIAAECTVASDEHRAAGTIDGIGRCEKLGQDVVLVDVKTGAKLGPEVLAQLGSYKAFPQLWLRSGLIVAKPRVDRCAILHLRASYRRGYKLLSVTDAELALGWEWWQQCRRQLEQAARVPKKFGRALYPPLPDGSQPAPMVEDLTSYAGCSRAVKPLIEAGFEWLSEVAVLHRSDVQEINGVGPKTVAALAEVLAGCGLAFRGERIPAQREAAA